MMFTVGPKSMSYPWNFCSAPTTAPYASAVDWSKLAASAIAAGNAVAAAPGCPVVRTPTAPSAPERAGTSTSGAAPPVTIAILSDCDIELSSIVAGTSGDSEVLHHAHEPQRPAARAQVGTASKATTLATTAAR